METSTLLSRVQWKDLLKLSAREKFIENTITIPWLLASWVLAYFHLYFFALPCSFLFFLTALRQSHNGFHHSLGISKRATRMSIYLNSVLMLSSMHAVKFTHLRHHKYCMGEKDFEGKCAKMRWHQAILYGPRHILSIHRAAITLGNKIYKRDVLIELLSIIIFISAVVLLKWNFLVYHCIAMAAGEFFSAFFAVWTVHHDLEGSAIARTQRTKWKNLVSYNMFYHLEHHLFPAVPTIKLPELARRIDTAAPGLEKKTTF